MNNIFSCHESSGIVPSKTCWRARLGARGYRWCIRCIV